jgi:hypothetical protein
LTLESLQRQGGNDVSDREKLMALRDATVDARRKAALGLDVGDPNSLETLTRTHIVIMALDAVIDELPPDADVEALVG